MIPKTQYQPGTLLRHKTIPGLLIVCLVESSASVLVLSPRKGGTMLLDKLCVFERFEAVPIDEEDQ